MHFQFLTIDIEYICIFEFGGGVFGANLDTSAVPLYLRLREIYYFRRLRALTPVQLGVCTPENA